MNDLDYFTREVLFRHISSEVHGPFKAFQHRIKNGTISWAVTVRYSNEEEIRRGSVSTSVIADKVAKRKKEYLRNYPNYKG